MAKALDAFLGGYKTRSPVVKEIIAGRQEGDGKLKGGLEDAEKMLGQVSALFARKVGQDEGNAVRDVLLQAGKAVANATREALFGRTESATEKKILARIEAALKAAEPEAQRKERSPRRRGRRPRLRRNRESMS